MFANLNANQWFIWKAIVLVPGPLFFDEKFLLLGTSKKTLVFHDGSIDIKGHADDLVI